MAADPFSVVYDEQIRKMREAQAKQAKIESKNMSFLASQTKEIATWGVSPDNPLNIIRATAAGLMSTLNSFLLPLGSGAFNAIKTPFETVEALGNGLQDFLGALLALDQMVMYQIQRVQNYRMTATLGAIRSACREIENINNTVDDISAAFGGGFNLDSLIDDWEWRFEEAYSIIDDAFNEDKGTVHDSWENVVPLLEEITQGSYRGDNIVADFRKLANAVNASKKKTNEMEKLWASLDKNIEDSLKLLANIKEGAKLNRMLLRALAKAKQNLGESNDMLGYLKSGCRYDPNKVFTGLTKILGHADSSLIALLKSRINDFNIDPDNIDISSPCVLVAYDAYLDDLNLLKRNMSNNAASVSKQKVYINALISYAVTGDTKTKESMDAAKAATQGSKSSCDSFYDDASSVFDGWNEITSDIGEGALGVLGNISDIGGSVDAALDLILGAQAFVLDTFEDFLAATPVGRMYMIIMRCLGVSPELLGTGPSTGFDSDIENNVLDGLSNMTAALEGTAASIAETMNSVFSWLSQIDTEIAEFIAALIGLLRFCEGHSSFSDIGDYGGDFSSDASTSLNSDMYNSIIGPNDDGYSASLEDTKDEHGGCCLR
jgi:hypothetical protein